MRVTGKPQQKQNAHWQALEDEPLQRLSTHKGCGARGQAIWHPLPLPTQVGLAHSDTATCPSGKGKGGWRTAVDLYTEYLSRGCTLPASLSARKDVVSKPVLGVWQVYMHTSAASRQEILRSRCGQCSTTTHLTAAPATVKRSSPWWWCCWWWCCRASCPRKSVGTLGTNWDQRVSMVQYCFTSTETVRLVRTDSPRRPPRLSRSSWTMTGIRQDYTDFVPREKPDVKPDSPSSYVINHRHAFRRWRVRWSWLWTDNGRVTPASKRLEDRSGLLLGRPKSGL